MEHAKLWEDPDAGCQKKCCQTQGRYLTLQIGDKQGDELKKARKDCDDLKRDMKALEIFLQDQEDHQEHCPEIKWVQPDIDVYKKTLKSQLPEGCVE